MLVSLVAALSFGLCDAKDIFGFRWKDQISLEKLNQHLTQEQFNPDATEVARLLASTKDKQCKPEGSGGHTVYELLGLALQPDDEPVADCDARHFDYIKKVCETLASPTGNSRLLNYCNHCYQAQFEFCGENLARIFNYVMMRFYRRSELIKMSQQISEFTVSDGKEEKPEKENISSLMSQLNDRGLVTKICTELLEAVKENLLFFDKDDEKTSKLLAGVEKTKSKDPRTTHAIYRRCAIINKLYRESSDQQAN